LHYDPYDVTIDAGPYPVYRRLRDEAPLYRDESRDFWGLSQFTDVVAALKDTAVARRAPTSIARGWDSMPAVIG